MRTAFPFPAMRQRGQAAARREPPRRELPRKAPFPMRFVNKRGKEYFRYIDDVSEPIDDAGFIRTVWRCGQRLSRSNQTRSGRSPTERSTLANSDGMR